MFCFDFSSTGHSHIGSLITMKSRKRLAHGIFDAAAIHASLDCDVTEMDCWAQNGYARGHDFATFNIDFQHRGGGIEFEKKI